MDSFMDEWLWEPAGGAFSVTCPAKTTLFAGRQIGHSPQLCGNHLRFPPIDTSTQRLALP
jgi:hypothetical protein